MSNRNLVEAIESRVLLSAGQLDHSFGDGGLVALSRNTAAAQVLPLDDGRLLVVGNRSGVYVRRLTGRGQPDPTFPEANLRRQLRPIMVHLDAAALDANQRLLLVDDSSSISRVTTSGNLDRKFGKNGVVDIPFETVTAITALPDGRIAVAGRMKTTSDDSDPDNTQTVYDDGIAVLNDKGGFDPRFDGDGIVQTDGYHSIYGALITSSESIDNRQMIPLSHGRLLYLRRDRYAGTSYDQGILEPGTEFDHTSIRADVYRSDGTLDPSFQFDRTSQLTAAGGGRSGSLLQGAAAAGHNSTFLFGLTDDAGFEEVDRNDHLFAFILSPIGELTRASLATHFSDVQVLRENYSSVLVQNANKASEILRYTPSMGRDNRFVTDPFLASDNPTVVSLVNSGDGQVLALYQRHNGNDSSSFLAKLQSSDAPAGVFSGTSIRTERTSYTFKVTWSDDGKVDASSVDSSDVLVVGPDGSELRARRLSIDPASDSGVIEATYRAIGPGGSWDSADNGTYYVRVRSNHVFDTEGHAAKGRVVGRFGVRIPAHV